MTIDIDAIRKREQAATTGPWTTGADKEWSDALAPWALVIDANYPLIELQEGPQGAADAEFIAAARTDIPGLLAELDKVRAQLAAANRRAAEACNKIDGLLAYLEDGLALGTAEVRNLVIDLTAINDEMSEVAR